MWRPPPEARKPRGLPEVFNWLNSVRRRPPPPARRQAETAGSRSRSTSQGRPARGSKRPLVAVAPEERVGFELPVLRLKPSRRIASETEPRNLATEKTRAAAAAGPGTRGLWFGCKMESLPKPRGIAGISRAAPRCGREVSATADYMAEQVEFELSVLFGEPGANPNRPTCQQRKTRAASQSSTPRRRCRPRSPGTSRPPPCDVGHGEVKWAVDIRM